MGDVDYLWSTGATTQDVNTLQPGDYTVTISDTLHDTIVMIIPIYEKEDAAWYSQTGCTITGNEDEILTSTSAGAWTTSQGISFCYLEADQDGEFVYTETQATHHKTIGFVDESIGNTLDSQDDWLYAIHLTSTQAEYRESSVTAKTLIVETAATNDEYRITRIGTDLSYYKNGILLRRVTVSPTSRWTFHAAFDNNITNANVRDINVSFVYPLGLFFKNHSFAHLHEHLDGTFYKPAYNHLAVYFDEKYTDGSLTYRIKDQSNTVIVDNTLMTITKGYGQNWFNFFLGGAGLIDNNFYVLEVENEKGRVQKLRFKYRSL